MYGETPSHDRSVRRGVSLSLPMETLSSNADTICSHKSLPLVCMSKYDILIRKQFVFDTLRGPMVLVTSKNPESLDLSIQSALSTLFPPFEATAPVVLSQLFRTIDERYKGDALQCLLDFLIPSKHLLESVQQAACAVYSDVVFRHEGWPLCLHDKTVIQLASVNSLLLRPGDFYLQVEPFGDQAARIVLKSLLEEGCREVEETPIPETSYPCVFTEDWLQDINEGRNGTPLARCLLCTDQGVIKLPWAKIAIPEFLDRPKTVPTCGESPSPPRPVSLSSNFNSSTLPAEALFHPTEGRMSASLRPVHSSSKLIKVDHDRRTPKSSSKLLNKPVGWVSPNTWETLNYQEIEGDYVDLVNIVKEKQCVDKQQDSYESSVLLKPVRPPPPIPVGKKSHGGQTLQCRVESYCSHGHLRSDLIDQELKTRYRESYLAALKNPVTFERGSSDLLAALEEVGLCEEGDAERKGACVAERHQQQQRMCDRCPEPTISNASIQCKTNSDAPYGKLMCRFPSGCGPENFMKEAPETLKSIHCDMVQSKLFSQQGQGLIACVSQEHDASLATCDGDLKLKMREVAVKPSGKHKVKVRSLSAVSDTPMGSPSLYKLNNRSHSDVCPEAVSSIIHCERVVVKDQESANPERIKCSKKADSLSSSIDDTNSSGFIQCSSHAEKRTSAATSECRQIPQNEEAAFRTVSGLLELGIVCLPGSRDRNGRAVVEVHSDRKEWMSSLVSAESICELLLYLHSIPRTDVRELGMTLLINGRKKTPPLHLYKALLMAQEHALHAVHSIIVLVDKDCSRPEKQPGLQMDFVTSTKALNKTVEASQLTSDLGGTFIYSHSDWLQFHKKLVTFMTHLRGANSLLQRAIKKVDCRKQMDTAQDVQHSMQEQKVLMKEVLEDVRLVTLQKEGGTLLARMKKEEFRFPQSEDYRDALEAATSLYNQVEEKLHMLVMKSNESLQHLEVLLRLREVEAQIISAGSWFNSEGEGILKKPIPDTAACAGKALQEFDLFLSQAKDKQQHALTLTTEAEKFIGRTSSTPATEVFRTLVNTFKSNVDDIMLRARKRHKELLSVVQIYKFCEQATALADECSLFLEQLEETPFSAQTQSALQMFAQRLNAEFSTSHFEARRAEVSVVGARASGIMRVWNSARVLSQEVKLRLEGMQKKKGNADKNQTQQTADANPVGEKKTEGSLREGAPFGEFTGSKSTVLNDDGHLGSRIGPREHHSEADLRSTRCPGEAPHQTLGRSLSEGSHVTRISAFSPISHKHCHSRKHSLDQFLQHTQDHHEASLGENREGCEGEREEPNISTESHEETETSETLHNNDSNELKAQQILEDLLSTEREYVKALGYVREHYFPELERPDVPQDLRGQRGSIFGNLEKLHDFHRHHFLHELEACVSEPFRVGRCFLRHRESFALYALYSKNKPQSDRLLIEHGKSFFKEKQLKLGDKMDLWSYLLKPVQRISKYSLLLQDVMAECRAEQAREVAEMKAALDVIHFQLRHGNNLLAMDAICQCDVNLKEQGQLIRQDEFSVTFRKKKCFRHLFLFQDLILFSKTRKTDVGNDTYVYKQSFKTSDIGMTQNSGDSGLCFEIWFRKRKSQDTYTLQAASREVKEAWTRDLERILWEQAIHNREVRMQERVFLGIGNKPFMDIQPSEAAINDRAINYVLIGRAESKPLSSARSQGDHPGGRPKSLGSGSSSSSSSSSGRGSLPPVGFVCGPKQRMRSVGPAGYVPLHGALEDDMDHECGHQNLLLDSSESSGESVSGLSSCSRSFHSAAGEAEDNTSVCSSVVTVKHAGAAHSPKAFAASQRMNVLLGSAVKVPPPVAPKHQRQSQSKDPEESSDQSSSAGKTTEV